MSLADDTVRKVTREFIADEHPEKLEELDIVFPELRRVIEDMPADALGAVDDAHHADDVGGMPFDFASLGDATVVLAVFVSASLVKAAAKAAVKDDVPRLLDRLESAFCAATGRPDLVQSIRRRVQRVLEEL